MKVADQHKELEEYFHGAGNNDPDFLSMVDKLLSGLTPFQKLFETKSQTAINISKQSHLKNYPWL